MPGGRNMVVVKAGDAKKSYSFTVEPGDCDQDVQRPAPAISLGPVKGGGVRDPLSALQPVL